MTAPSGHYQGSGTAAAATHWGYLNETTLHRSPRARCGAARVSRRSLGAGTSEARPPVRDEASPSGCRTTRESGWKDVVAVANNAFKARHGDVEVDVQYQTWGDHLTKFDAALAGGNAPDVIEMGNTETTRYMAARAAPGSDHADRELPELARPGSRALKDSCTLQRQALLRPVLRGRARGDLPQGPVQARPASRARRRASAEFQAAGQKLMKQLRRSSATSPRSTSRASTVAAHVLRLRLRREDRRDEGRPLAGHARLAARRCRA